MEMTLILNLYEYFCEMITIILVTTLIIYAVYMLVRQLYCKGVISSDGKAVLITGCGAGLGYRLAQTLNQIGFKVYATVRSIDSLGAQELHRNAVFAHKMIVLQMNVTNDCEVKEVYEKVKLDLQSSGDVLWAVVNNAGVISFGPLDWGSLDIYREIFETNVFGTVRVTRAFLQFIKSAQGRIINVSSVAGRFCVPQIGFYSMTKYSLTAFTDTLRRELYKSKVKVLSIEPGVFRTKMTSKSSLINTMDANWDQSTDEVKTFYGSSQSEKEFALQIQNKLPAQDIDIVAHVAIDAIINCRPKPVYCSTRHKIIYCTLFNYLPTSFADALVYLVDMFVRASAKN